MAHPDIIWLAIAVVVLAAIVTLAAAKVAGDYDTVTEDEPCSDFDELLLTDRVLHGERP